MSLDTDKKLVILCGPSGSGKSTLAHHLIRQMSELTFSISATTRLRRRGEKDKKDYYFLTTPEFTGRIAGSEFIEFEEVYPGRFYGTLKSELERIWQTKKTPLLDVDVVGALNIKETYAPQALGIFVHPVSIDNIRRRLIQRGTETQEDLEKRVAHAMHELDMAPMLDCIVYNEHIQTACAAAEKQITAYLQSTQSTKS